MIDDSDGDFALLSSSGMGPIGGLIGLILAIVLYYVACQNKKECAEMDCPNGGHAELVAHDCRCFDNPIPRGATSANVTSEKK